MTLPTSGLFRPILASSIGALLLSAVSGIAWAQTPPETIRINVEPPKPGIRSVSVNKKYKPIISRDDAGVIIDTLGSSTTPPACDAELEVTLENSRVLYRAANLCAGGALVVDVDQDGKPGAARVIQDTAGSLQGSSRPSVPARAETKTERQPVTPQPSADNDPVFDTGADTPEVATQDPNQSPDSQTEGGLPPLERMDSPIDAPGITPEVAGQPGQTDVNQGSQSGYILMPSTDRVWSIEAGSNPGDRSTLVHSVPSTNNSDFVAACGTQSGQATIVFSQASPTTAQGVSETVRISAGDFSAVYNAVGSSSNNAFGQSFPEVVLPVTDPLWEALIKQSELTFEVGGTPPYKVSLKGSANPVRLFVATCAPAQTIVGEGNSGPLAESDVSCGELGRIQSLEANQPGQIVFRNNSQSPVEVNWIDYGGGERSYARLEPGQLLEQQTFVSHAWSLRDGNTGQCLGIYVSRTPYREVTVSGSQPSFPQGQPSFDQQGGFGQPQGGFGQQQGGFGQPQQDAFPAGPIPPGNVGGQQGGFAPQGGGFGQVAGRVVDYQCTGGVDLRVSFSADGRNAEVAEMGSGIYTLARQNSASSLDFASNGARLTGQITEPVWSRPGDRDVFCSLR